MKSSVQQRSYQILTNDDEARLCQDIPESACDEQPRNFLTHVFSLGMTKTGDGLADPKLILTWLMQAIGAPAPLIGLLVPIRESLALLPQLFTATWIRQLPRRKWVWVTGSFVQGLCVIGMALAASTLDGSSAGWIILLLLMVFATARSLCSVSYKDLLGKTVARGTRGTATGLASTAAACVVLALGLALALRFIPLTVSTISTALVLAGVLWLGAALLFARLPEKPGATEGGKSGIKAALQQFDLLRRDAQLRRFIEVRGLLIATALAPPYFVTLAGRQGTSGLDHLGAFVIGSALAGVVSTYAWGRLADQSSRNVLFWASIVANLFLTTAGLSGILLPKLAHSAYWLPVLLFGLMIAYKGVRLGRSTHLVDMADPELRSAYTALSNTIIGVLLILGGGFGVLAEYVGSAVVLLVFAGMCAVAGILALGLEEVQKN